TLPTKANTQDVKDGGDTETNHSNIRSYSPSVASMVTDGSQLNLPADLEQLAILASHIASLRTKPLFADVIFVVGGQEFAAHKTILAARSPIFHTLFSAENSPSGEAQPTRIEVTPNVDPVVFEA